ncbi:MAG: viroplasmin family protein [Tannerellaceae bacterium]|jgi:ribonuclease HI|nr:viroplasmin family protein [Tannerellaceae bacterium]
MKQGANRKYYVVWQGRNAGVFDNWNDCKTQIDGYDNAKYKSFPTRAEAVKAFEDGHNKHLRNHNFHASPAKKQPVAARPEPVSLAVDAACSGNPGVMEYRGVLTTNGKEIFRMGPFPQGTNNIGEFLALVHGLAILKQQNSPMPIYSDSVNAIKWVTNKKCKTQLKQNTINAPVFDLIERAEKWLHSNTYTTPILKWETASWGEIPADFGRK